MVHTPHSSRGGGAPLLHSERFGPREVVPILNFVGLSLVDCGLEGPRCVNVISSQLPGQDSPLRSQTYGFLRRLWLGIRGVWLKPSNSGIRIVWHHLCPPDIIDDLVLVTNPGGVLTNSNLNIYALFFHEATLLMAVLKAIMAAPCSGSNNNPTVSYST